jgi:hypothetical protein
VIPTGLLTSTDNTPHQPVSERRPSTQREGASFTTNLPSFRTGFAANNPQHASEEACPSLLNVTGLFIKEGRKEEFILKGDKNLLRMAKYLATSKPEEKTRAK